MLLKMFLLRLVQIKNDEKLQSFLTLCHKVCQLTSFISRYINIFFIFRPPPVVSPFSPELYNPKHLWNINNIVIIKLYLPRVTVFSDHWSMTQWFSVTFHNTSISLLLWTSVWVILSPQLERWERRDYTNDLTFLDKAGDWTRNLLAGCWRSYQL